MQHIELNYYLTTMLNASSSGPDAAFDGKEISDLNLTVDKPLQVERNGELAPVACDPPIERLTPFQTEMFALNLINGSSRLLRDLLNSGSCDLSYSLENQIRFRVNVFTQRGNLSVVLRKLNTKIPTFAQLNLPDIIHQVSQEKNGLVLVTGATGAGKTSTLAAVVNEINENKSVHIITLEDPVEFVHPQKKSTLNQREMGSDFTDFATGLRAALRQAPKVVLVGEIRDRETVEVALNAAETGHLVLSTLHTINAGLSINRILGFFKPEEQDQVRVRLSDSLRWVISQRLVPKIGGGRYGLFEIMGSNLRIRETIIQGESEGKSYNEIIEASQIFGWRTFDQAAISAYENNIIDEQTALTFCTRRGVVSRGIDRIKHERGQATVHSDLRMKSDAPPAPASTPVPPPLKMK